MLQRAIEDVMQSAYDWVKYGSGGKPYRIDIVFNGQNVHAVVVRLEDGIILHQSFPQYVG